MKSDRLDLRLTSQQKQEIERAAAIAGRTVSDFSVSALVKEAAATIAQERDLAIAQQEWEAFNAAIQQPARPVEGFTRLLQHRTVFTD